MVSFSNEIWGYALKNAMEFGKCDAGRIMPKLFQHGLDKKDIKKIMPEIQKIVSEVNKMKNDEREKKFGNYEGYVKEHEARDENQLPELDGAVDGKVVTRLAPEPSKYNHIGHALVFIIQDMYAKKYNGKCILRFDDTNPEKSTKEYYDAMKEDLRWLGLKWDKELVASDDMASMYKYAEQLIKNNHAFVCSCSSETMKKLREEMKECSCRKRKSEDNMNDWKAMLDNKFKDGERTLRLKGDMKSNNGVMRDPVIFRISEHPHFKQGKKYCVWPMYDFENPVQDSLNGVTHVIRSNEFELREELHKYILKLLGLKAPIVREIGRYQITGAETQGRVIREMIEKKEINGWDDPRLVTIKALKRRGFVPEMFHELAKRVGLSKSSGHIDPTVLAAVNRQIIDPIANRHSFAEDPVEVKVKNAPDIKEIEVPIHPDKDEMRKVKVDSSKIYISKKDFSEFSGKEVRLLHLYNIKLGKTKNAEFVSVDNKDIPKITWISYPVKASILMPDGKLVSGYAGESIWDLKPSQLIQFERFGFCKFDRLHKNVYEFWFAHK